MRSYLASAEQTKRKIKLNDSQTGPLCHANLVYLPKPCNVENSEQKCQVTQETRLACVKDVSRKISISGQRSKPMDLCVSPHINGKLMLQWFQPRTKVIRQTAVFSPQKDEDIKECKRDCLCRQQSYIKGYVLNALSSHRLVLVEINSVSACQSHSRLK